MVRLDTLDWIIVAAILVVSLSIGVLVSRRAGASSSSFFLSGRSMPWWLLGISMVATTFSTDTPNLVSEIVRTNGVAGRLLKSIVTCWTENSQHLPENSLTKSMSHRLAIVSTPPCLYAPTPSLSVWASICAVAKGTA